MAASFACGLDASSFLYSGDGSRILVCAGVALAQAFMNANSPHISLSPRVLKRLLYLLESIDKIFQLLYRYHLLGRLIRWQQREYFYTEWIYRAWWELTATIEELSITIAAFEDSHRSIET